jgi:hypothetical protein
MTRARKYDIVIIDPDHERYGEIGENSLGVSATGYCVVEFADGDSDAFNTGLVTGIPQYAAIYRAEHKKVERLVNALAELRPLITEIKRVVKDPEKKPPTRDTIAARGALYFLMESIINPDKPIPTRSEDSL